MGGLSLGPYDGPREGAFSYEQSTLVIGLKAMEKEGVELHRGAQLAPGHW
jgi:hypothetical protein